MTTDGTESGNQTIWGNGCKGLQIFNSLHYGEREVEGRVGRGEGCVCVCVLILTVHLFDIFTVPAPHMRNFRLRGVN